MRKYGTLFMVVGLWVETQTHGLANVRRKYQSNVLRIPFLWDMTPCQWIVGFRRFEGT